MSSIGAAGPVPSPEPFDAGEPAWCEAPATPPEEAGVARDGPTSDAWQARLQNVNRGESTALQRHLEFFDTNDDRELSVGEVRRGLERLGMDSWIERVFSSTLNNVLLGGPTRGRFLSLSVDLNNIHKARHEGDTGIYDEKGHFVPERFEAVWREFDKDGDGRLTRTETEAMVAENTKDIGGVTRAKFSAEAEFKLLMDLCGYEDASGERYVTPERLLAFYDGTLFDAMAAEVKLFGGVVRHPIPTDDPARSGPLPSLARRSAGAAAGPASGALEGASLLTEDAPPFDGASDALVGGMLAACPYLGAAMGPVDAGAQPV